jgi:steroid 5-alpha reductase family enzyme
LAFSTIENTWTIISPVILTFLIVKVSGIPMLEKKYENNASFQVYKSKTSALILWFQKK